MVIVTHLLKMPKPLHCTLWTVTGKWQLDFSLIKYSFFQWEWVDGRNTIQHLWWCCFWPELPGSANDLLHFGSLKIWDFWHFLRAAKSSSYISWESFLHSFNPLPLLIHSPWNPGESLFTVKPIKRSVLQQCQATGALIMCPRLHVSLTLTTEPSVEVES